MTVRQLREEVCDSELFHDKDQDLAFKIGQVYYEIDGCYVPDKGTAVIRLRPLRMKKFLVSFKFEANSVIEARTAEDAKEKARAMMKGEAVMKRGPSGSFDEIDGYVAQEPYILEES